MAVAVGSIHGVAARAEHWERHPTGLNNENDCKSHRTPINQSNKQTNKQKTNERTNDAQEESTFDLKVLVISSHEEKINQRRRPSTSALLLLLLLLAVLTTLFNVFGQLLRLL
mmetsp:Transcript_7645/g.13542  ORF Transcript_7645/g.13542 Transcript_7645/m.13542 type:complete len:113 (+) Transcript_7645:544-882(+)